MTTARQRIAHYLVERAKMRQIDPDVIHSLHVGEPNEARLNVADLMAVSQIRSDVGHPSNLAGWLEELASFSWPDKAGNLISAADHLRKLEKECARLQAIIDNPGSSFEVEMVQEHAKATLIVDAAFKFPLPVRASYSFPLYELAHFAHGDGRDFGGRIGTRMARRLIEVWVDRIGPELVQAILDAVRAKMGVGQ